MSLWEIALVGVHMTGLPLNGEIAAWHTSHFGGWRGYLSRHPA